MNPMDCSCFYRLPGVWRPTVFWVLWALCVPGALKISLESPATAQEPEAVAGLTDQADAGISTQAPPTQGSPQVGEREPDRQAAVGETSTQASGEKSFLEDAEIARDLPPRGDTADTGERPLAPSRSQPNASSGPNDQLVSHGLSLDASPRGLDFPEVGSITWSSSPVNGSLQVRERWYEVPFAFGKLALIFLCVVLWLRYLAKSSDDANLSGMNKADRLQADRWTAKLFWVGLLGIGLAALLPASLWSAALLIAATLVPFGVFMHWQHAHLGEQTQKLTWSPFLNTTQTGQPVFESIPFGAASLSHTATGLAAGGTGEPADLSHSIRLVGKSALRGSTSAFSQSAEHSPAFRYVLSMIGEAVASNATDLHINSKTNHVEIRQRVDGSLEALPDLPLNAGLAVINILKVMSELSIADKSHSQDGSFLVDVDKRRLSFRVSSQGTQTGEKLSIRILDPATSFNSLESLGMQPSMVVQLEKQLHQRHGLILFVGATGAGKSTTACAALQLIDTSSKNVVSIEDPIEYQIPSIDQIEVNLKAGQSFQSALRSVLRLDADVVFIGEVRDAETAQIAVQAAQTGQLVLATMHANDSVGGFTRLADLTGDPTGVASTVRAVVAQTLVRKLCPRCRTEYAADVSTADEVGTTPNAALYETSTDLTAPCTTCNGRRVLRRTGVYELTIANSEIRELVRQHAAASQLTAAAQATGMIPLREQASELVREGVISVNELNRVFGD